MSKRTADPVEERYHKKQRIAEGTQLKPVEEGDFGAALLRGGVAVQQPQVGVQKTHLESTIPPSRKSSIEPPPFVGLTLQSELRECLELILESIAPPKIWNSVATQHMINFNKRFTNEGPFMEKENGCDHPVLYRLLHLLNYIAGKSISAIVKVMVEAGGCKQEEVEVVIDEFLTQAFFMLALLGRNEAARATIVKYRGASILPTLLHCYDVREKIPQAFINCCFALGQVLTSVTEYEQAFRQRILSVDTFTGTNTLHHLFNVLKRHYTDSQVAQYVFFAIGNMTFICDLESEILEEDGIECAKASLERHIDLVHVVSDLIFFLKNLAFGSRGREEIKNKGLIPKILEVLVRHRDHHELVDLGQNLLFDMTFSEGVIEELMSNPAYPRFFLMLIKQHRSNFAVVQQCVRTLTRIYLNTNNESRAFLIKEGYMNCLVFLHTNYAQDAEKMSLVESIFTRLDREELPTLENSYGREEELHPAHMPNFETSSEHSKEAGKKIKQEQNENITVEPPVEEKKTTEERESSHCCPNTRSTGRNHVLSLKELSARAIAKQNPLVCQKDTSCSSALNNTMGNNNSSEDYEIPDDIVCYLKSSRVCDLCSNRFFESWHETIFPALFIHLQQRVPLYWALCSTDCLSKLKQSLPTVSQATIVRSSAP